MNRWLGPTATIYREAERLLAGKRCGHLRVLDVGAGGGDMLRSLSGWCERRAIAFDGVALDAGRQAVRQAVRELRKSVRGEHVRVIRGDALALPFPDRSFDVAIGSTFLHHLEPEAAVKALREMMRVSELGVIVSDLRRCVSGYAAAWILANTVWRSHRYTRHDARVSMRTAYTIDEARALASRAGLAAEVEPQLWFRWVLRWKRE